MAAVLNEEGIILRAEDGGLKVEGLPVLMKKKAKTAELKI